LGNDDDTAKSEFNHYTTFITKNGFDKQSKKREIKERIKNLKREQDIENII
jgi:hypothetical protein